MCENGKPVPLGDADYQKAVAGLVEAGKVAYKAAQAKDLDAMLEAGGVVTDACAACHEKYRDKDNNADRCTPTSTGANSSSVCATASDLPSSRWPPGRNA